MASANRQRFIQAGGWWGKYGSPYIGLRLERALEKQGTSVALRKGSEGGAQWGNKSIIVQCS